MKRFDVWMTARDEQRRSCDALYVHYFDTDECTRALKKLTNDRSDQSRHEYDVPRALQCVGKPFCCRMHSCTRTRLRRYTDACSATLRMVRAGFQLSSLKIFPVTVSIVQEYQSLAVASSADWRLAPS